MSTLALSPAGRRYGALRSPKDVRDFGITRIPRKIGGLPSAVSLEAALGPVRDQGDLGACTAFAGCAMREYLANRYEPPAAVPQVYSPLFLYYLERQLDGDLADGDTGSTGRTCVRVLNKYGVCLEPTDPYDISVFQTAPSTADIQEAATHKAGAYHALANVMDMKSCLYSGYGFIVGFTVYDSFESDGLATSGLMPMPDKTKESVLGGHEVFFCGYDDSVQCPNAAQPGAFQVQNSWGTSWGQKGLFYFPYTAILDSDIFMDAFIQHLGPPW